MFERSEFGAVPWFIEKRRVPVHSTGSRLAARGWRRVSFGYFSFRAKRKVTPMNSEAPSARATRKTPIPQPFWLTATLPRINTPAISICTVTASPRNNHANAAPNSGIR